LKLGGHGLDPTLYRAPSKLNCKLCQQSCHAVDKSPGRYYGAVGFGHDYVWAMTQPMIADFLVLVRLRQERRKRFVNAWRVFRQTREFTADAQMRLRDLPVRSTMKASAGASPRA
jgi:hypothetical protein